MSRLIIGSFLALALISCSAAKFPFGASHNVHTRATADTVYHEYVGQMFFQPLKGRIDSVWSPSANSQELLVTAVFSRQTGSGKYRVLLSNGNPYMECDMVKRKLNGLCTLYSRIESGRVAVKASVLKGSIDGELVEYDMSGSIVRTCLYRKGRLISCRDTPH
jgi:hypothetical protein